MLRHAAMNALGHYITVSIDRTAAPPGSTDQYGPVNRPREIWLNHPSLARRPYGCFRMPHHW
jgi:hypothetical protein